MFINTSAISIYCWLVIEMRQSSVFRRALKNLQNDMKGIHLAFTIICNDNRRALIFVGISEQKYGLFQWIKAKENWHLFAMSWACTINNCNILHFISSWRWLENTFLMFDEWDHWIYFAFLNHDRKRLYLITRLVLWR